MFKMGFLIHNLWHIKFLISGFIELITTKLKQSVTFMKMFDNILLKNLKNLFVREGFKHNEHFFVTIL